MGEYKGRESYLWVGSVGARVAGGGPAVETGAWRRWWWQHAAALRRGRAVVVGLGSFRGSRVTRLEARLGRELAGGSGSMVNRAPSRASMAAGDGGADSSRGRARARHGEVRDVVEEALARGIKGWWPEVVGAPAEAALLSSI